MYANLMDNFDASTLTDAVNSAPYQKGVIAKSGIFFDGPVNTTKVRIEQIDADLSLVPASLRGSPGNVHPNASRKLVDLDAPHYRTHDSMFADSWQNRRGFGEATLADVLPERDRLLTEMRKRIELTIEYQRARAFNGVILDSNGDVLVDLLAAFGVSQNILDFDLGNAAVNTNTKIVAAKRAAEAELDVPVTEYIGFASPAFLDALREHPSTVEARAGWQAASDLKDGSMVFTQGGVQWHEVAPVAGVNFIDAGAAFLVPKVNKLCRTYFAPADYLDTVNQEGIPLYARAEALQMNRGVRLEVQSNPVSVISRPRAVIRCEA